MPKLHTIHFDLLCVAANWNAICLCCQTAYMLWMPCALKCENVIFSHFHLLLSFSVHFHLCARIELKICRAAAVLYCLSANAVAFNNQLSCCRSLLVCRSNLFFLIDVKKNVKVQQISEIRMFMLSNTFQTHRTDATSAVCSTKCEILDLSDAMQRIANLRAQCYKVRCRALQLT